jgi:hypothetical protein
LFLERIDGTKVALERGFELAVTELATTLLNRGEILPEERVVDVAFDPREEQLSAVQGSKRVGSLPPPLNLSAGWRAILSRVDGALTYEASAALRPST